MIVNPYGQLAYTRSTRHSISTITAEPASETAAPMFSSRYPAPVQRPHIGRFAAAVAVGIMAVSIPTQGAPLFPPTASTTLTKANLQEVPQIAETPAPVTPAEPPPLDGITVVVDAGHGGPDTGTINADLGLREKDLNLDIALRVQGELQERGATVIMTRTTDTEVVPGNDQRAELLARSNISNAANADLFVSIHNNSAPRASASGTEVYISRRATPDSVALGTSIYDQLDADLPTAGNGVRRAGFSVLRHTNAPAVLAEVAYVSNADDAARLRDPEFRQDAAEAIADGVTDYIIARGGNGGMV